MPCRSCEEDVSSDESELSHCCKYCERNEISRSCKKTKCSSKHHKPCKKTCKKSDNSYEKEEITNTSSKCIVININ
jgi:hypothetical protein